MQVIRIPVLIVILCVASLGIANSGGEKPFRAKIDDDGVQRVTIVGGEYFFRPSHIVVKVNMPVELTATKTSKIVPHDIMIDAPDAGMDFKLSMSGKGSTIIFTPTKTGKYVFYCSKRFLFFKSHRDKGMEGIMEVAK